MSNFCVPKLVCCLNRFRILSRFHIFQREHWSRIIYLLVFLSVLQKKICWSHPIAPFYNLLDLFKHKWHISCKRSAKSFSFIWRRRRKKIPRRIWDCCVTNILNWIKGILRSTFVTFFRLLWNKVHLDSSFKVWE